MPDSPLKLSAALTPLVDKVRAGQRLSFDEAMTLYHEADLRLLGALAHEVRLRKAPADIVTYIVDRNINYSNVCVCGCRFCAFYKGPGAPGGYLITRDELSAKIQETLDLGGCQILMQGGHHPDLMLDFYEDLLRFIKERFPTIHIHAFSPPEIAHFAELNGLDIPTVIARLRRAGLDSIPGGGAEILVDEVRRAVSPNKCPAPVWLEVMRQAHGQGLLTTATMMFGHEERPEHRVQHLLALRELQDETGGFTAFIPWTFQPENTAIRVPPEGPAGYLRLLALARLVLDNFTNLQASWVTMGPKIGQLALHYGANDFGSTMIEENVVAAAGVRYRMSPQEVEDVVRAAGFAPRRRRQDYSLWQ